MAKPAAIRGLQTRLSHTDALYDADSKDTQKGWIYTGDSAENSLAVLLPIAIDLRTEEAWITSIGSVYPSDNPQGKLTVL